MKKFDDLSVRMKEQYENRTRYSLPRRTYSIIRLDGKAFHTYTRNLPRPYDTALATDIDNAVKILMSQVQGAQFAYCQSDEISILVTDFAQNNTCAWFDGNIQKICSVSSSIMTAEFNKNRFIRSQGVADFRELPLDPAEGLGSIEPFYYFDPGLIQQTMDQPLAYFDSRVFTIPDRIEVANYFIWRNNDCTRNSISMLAQHIFSHKELHGKTTKDMLQMIFDKTGKGWDSYSENEKNGRVIVKASMIPCCNGPQCDGCTSTKDKRDKWISIPAWKFTQDRINLENLIPSYPNL